ncbi:Transcription factor TFIIIB component B [Phytophthora boehmeriae]|uniref:Transcription factor TFIIIB component B n=1 Tax=Phytophthora boehmeriae TaxID=109152 RepID=A0A8T1X2U5_9STRA|nr:Transcription factor TFIIIB component B [Phytophthora boehmeriae]
MASRVPLLVKSKGRKPSRLPIAPRAKPSNAPRAKRPEPAVTNAPKKSEVLTSVTSQTEKPKDQANGDIAPVTKTAAKTAVHSAAKQAPAANVSLRRQAKRKNSYREEHGSSGSEPDDDRDEDVDPNDLDLPEEEAAIYVPARERATMWAKSVLQQNDDDGEENKEGETSQALVVREKKPKRPPTRRKRSSSTSSSIISLVGGVGLSTRDRMEELLKKEPSQMTMGEIALTVPKGRRMKRHEREEAATSADTPLPNSSPSASGEGSSSLLNMSALSRVRSLSVSSESAAFAGSLVTPQVQIIDGQMVVLESTIKLGDELQSTADALGGGNYGDDNTGLPPRHSGSRYNSSHQNTPGKRWGKEETKQFYYCLSQVGPNFSMMATLFPTRKRKELKSKFKYEEKNHSKLIEIALRASAAPLDTEMVNVISQMVDKEAQRKLNAQKKKRKAKSPLDALNDDQDVDETASVMSSSIAASPMSSSMLTPVAHAEEFVETMNDEDLFLPNRRDSFDFSG